MARDNKVRSSGCFLSCFGSEGREDPTRNRSKSKNKRSSRWLPSPRAWFKKSKSAKTVPVDTTAPLDISTDVASEKAEARRRYDESSIKPKSKVRRSKSSEKLAVSKRRGSETVTTTDQDKPPREVRTEATADPNPVQQSRSDHPEPDPVDTSDSARRKIDSTRAVTGESSQPGPPGGRTRPGPICRLASFPGPLGKKRVVGVSRSLDPVIGMSVILVTLIIMVLWGRVCAILCTCAWFYFIPQMRSVTRSDGGETSETDPDPDPDPTVLDLSSDKYKRKVVLEGLLERNRRGSLRERGVS